MMINLCNRLFIMSIVTGGLYLLLKLFSRITMRYFKMAWHYYTYIMIYSFFVLPYYKFISLIEPLFPKQNGNDSIFIFTEIFSAIEIPSYKLNETITNNKTLLNASIISYFLLIGTIVFVIITFIRNYNLHRRILSVCKLVDEEQTLDIFLKCKQKIKVSRKVLLYKSSYNTSPFFYGIFKPRIVIPNTEFTEEELEHIFCHELTHLKQGDALLKSLMLIINAIHWYNPLAYIARYDIDRLCEMSCDEALTRKMSQEERRQYCELILIVLQNMTIRGDKLYSAFSNKKQLKRRVNKIMTIKNFKKYGWANFFAVLVILMVISVGTITAHAASKDSSNDSSANAAIVESRDVILSKSDEKVYFESSDAKLVEDNSIILKSESIGITPMFLGELGVGKAFYYDKQYLTKGQKVTIYAEWTPTASNVNIGIKSTSGTVTAKTVSNGESSVTYEILTSGDYYIYIGNPSKSSVKFDISYAVY